MQMGAGTLLDGIEKAKLFDASADTNVGGGEITSDNHPIHISYMYPAQPSCLDGIEKYPRGHGVAAQVQEQKGTPRSRAECCHPYIHLICDRSCMFYIYTIIPVSIVRNPNIHVM